MPSRLVHTNPQFRERDRAKAQALASLGTATANGPWMGYVPDLIVNGMDPSYFADCNAIFPRAVTSAGSTGEVLMLEPGWARLDTADTSVTLPGSTTINHANPKVVWIGTFKSTNSITTYQTLAWTAGNGADENTAALWGVNVTTKAWTRILHSAAATTVRPEGNRDAMPDVALFAAGAPTRAAHTGPIDEPVMIITNNVDPVYVFPSGSGLATFEDLVELVGFAPFLAKSVEVFNNRVYYLNTSENSVRYPQRLRRSPPFTCDPLNTAVGSGASDLKDFAGDGLRIERLGTVLVCYFSDGVAFVRATGNYTAPDAFQTVSTSRGLISTHSLVNIGNDLHFGIFTDGWFELDPSGRFREVGLIDAGNGVISGKWKSTFYNLLTNNPDLRERLYCHYESSTDKVYISIPTDDDAENSQVWVYDRHADRVFLDTYEALCFGEVERQTRTGLTYVTVAPQTYDDISPETYATVEAKFGVKALVHGDSNGFIFQHDPEMITRDEPADTGNTTPYAHFKTHPLSFGNSHGLVCADRVLLEYVGFAMPAWGCEVSSLVLGASSSDTPQTAILNTTIGALGSVTTAYHSLRKSGPQLQFLFAGQGPMMFKSFSLDIFDEKVEFYGQ